MNAGFKRGAALLAVGLAVLLTGCATSSKIWTARVGNFTYDQAVVELGPPDKQARLENGTLIAEWLTRRGYEYADVMPGYYCHRFGPHFYPAVTRGYSPDYYLRLDFGADNKLQAWKQYVR